ncbi:MAG TPA: arginine deiminase-related protein [Planctomycetota bacterium]|nr:arginine deiminase-related protein [Planctomycetota bacterium]
MATIFMCPPDFYGIEYEINPWMHRTVKALTGRARDQWWSLYQVLQEDLGCRVELLRPVPKLPDLVFTANAGLVYGNSVVVSRFRHKERRGEERHFLRWFRARRFDATQPPAGMFFEGAGDALFSGSELFAGYHFRTDIRSHEWIAALWNVRVISLCLVDERFYHLDTCFCPLAHGQVIYYPPAFDEYGNKVIEDHFPAANRYAVTAAEARQFACNAVALETAVVTPARCPKLANQLRRWGYAVHAVELGEYLKAGGSAKCLTLQLPAAR